MLSENYIKVNPKETGVESIYKLLIGAIVPRPIAFISTLNKKGEANLAPFSFFNGVCSNPPCMMVSIARKPDGNKKDSLINIEETEEFVVNSASEWMIEKVVHCGAKYPYGVNEMKKAGLNSLPSELVKPVRVKESAFQMECVLYNKLEIGDGSVGTSTIVVGEIKLFHINETIYKDGKVDLAAYKPMARVGGPMYCELGKPRKIPIPEL
jgi:flavin reductase (DIM6/NTAB) family NADH-FMN oxidoreductase RutF